MTTKILVHYITILAFLRLFWFLIQVAKFTFQYTDNPIDSELAELEFEEHCKRKQYEKQVNANWKLIVPNEI